MSAAFKQHLGIGWSLVLVAYAIGSLFSLVLAGLSEASINPGLAVGLATGFQATSAATAALIGLHLGSRELQRQRLWQARRAPVQPLRHSSRQLGACLVLVTAGLSVPPVLSQFTSSSLIEAAHGLMLVALALTAGLASATAWAGAYGRLSLPLLIAGGLLLPLSGPWPGAQLLALVGLAGLVAIGWAGGPATPSDSPGQRARAAWQRSSAAWRGRFARLVPKKQRAGFAIIVGAQLPLALLRDPQGAWLAASVESSLDHSNSLFAAVVALMVALGLAWDGLLSRRLHWRDQLSPQGLQRPQFGWHVLRTTAKAWLLGGLLLLALLAGLGLLVAWLQFGLDASRWQALLSAERLRLGAGVLLQLALDLGFGLIVATWLRGLNGPGWQCLLLALVWLAAGTGLLLLVGQRGPASLLLLGLTALLLGRPIQRAWARRDLSALSAR